MDTPITLANFPLASFTTKFLSISSFYLHFFIYQWKVRGCKHNFMILILILFTLLIYYAPSPFQFLIFLHSFSCSPHFLIFIIQIKLLTIKFLNNTCWTTWTSNSRSFMTNETDKIQYGTLMMIFIQTLNKHTSVTCESIYLCNERGREYIGLLNLQITTHQGLKL